MSGPPANGNDFCVSLLLQLRGRRQSYKSMLKKGQLAPAETQGPSLTRARQMEQMTGTNGAYIGVTATHSCTLPQTDGRTCRCRTNHPLPLLSAASTGWADAVLSRWPPRTCHPTAAHPPSSWSARTRTRSCNASDFHTAQCQKCLISPHCAVALLTSNKCNPKPGLSIVSDELNIVLLRGNWQEVKQKREITLGWVFFCFFCFFYHQLPLSATSDLQIILQTLCAVRSYGVGQTGNDKLTNTGDSVQDCLC